MADKIPTAVLRALAGVGLLYVSAKLFSFVRLLASLFILPGASLSKFGPKGSWAVITGASDGIGKEFATQLARKGFNLVLVSRTQSKLEALAQELESANANIQTKTLAMDFSKNNDKDYALLKTLVSSLDVSILINNVGQSHSIPVPFLETPYDELKNIVTINNLGTLRVTQVVAPGMVSRKRGLILTMASFGGVFPTPLLATYSGSKAFLQHWGTALGGELAPHGVQVEVLQTHLVTSAMSKIKRPSMMVPTPKQFVRTALSKIGRTGGAQGLAHTSAPWWTHAFFLWVVATVVGTTSDFTLARNKTMHEAIRKRALARAAREGKKGQ